MKAKLKDLTKIRTGKLDANASSPDGQYPFFTCSKEPLKISSYSYDCECILVAGNGDLNVKYYNGKFDAYQRTYIIEENGSGRLFMQYLFYFMDGYVEVLRKLSIGGVIKYIKLGNLTDVLIELPSIEAQKKIVELLTKVKRIISDRKDELEKLDNLLKARFVEMFASVVPAVKLGSVCRMINGDRSKNYPSSNDFVSDGIPFINAGHLQNRQVDFSAMNYITVKKFNSLSQGKVQLNDVLYCLRGSLGKHAIVTFDRGAVASSLVILRCDKGKILPRYLLYAIETYDIEKQTKASSNGSSQPNLSASSVKDFEIILPQIADQQKFVSFVSQIDKSKAVVQKALDEAQLLFDSLMQKYFG